MKVIRNIFICFYCFILILIGVLTLSKNEYNISQLGKINIIVIDKNFSNKKYPSGSLVIVNTKKQNEIKAGEEVFIYNEKKDISIINPNEINNNVKIIGNEIIKIKYLGNVVNFIQTKWMFYIMIIVLFLFILIYEIINLLTTKIQNNKNNDDLEKTITIIKNKPEVNKKLNNIEEQMKELKFTTTSTNIFSEVVEDKDDKVDELMKEINKYRNENVKKEEPKEPVVENKNIKKNKNKNQQKQVNNKRNNKHNKKKNK